MSVSVSRSSSSQLSAQPIALPDLGASNGLSDEGPACGCAGDERCWDCTDSGAPAFYGVGDDDTGTDHHDSDGDRDDRHKRTDHLGAVGHHLRDGFPHRLGYLFAFAVGVSCSDYDSLGAVAFLVLGWAVIRRFRRDGGHAAGGRHGGSALGRWAARVPLGGANRARADGAVTR